MNMDMYKGGYILVDATGLDVSDSEKQTVDGLYERLERALETGKQIILTGMVNGDAAVFPTPASCTMGAGATITTSGFSALVSDDDSVTPVT